MERSDVCRDSDERGSGRGDVQLIGNRAGSDSRPDPRLRLLSRSLTELFSFRKNRSLAGRWPADVNSKSESS